MYWELHHGRAVAISFNLALVDQHQQPGALLAEKLREREVTMGYSRHTKIGI